MPSHPANTLLGHAFRRYEGAVPCAIQLVDRLMHLYIVGQSGTGKSTLLGNLARQDAVHGHGFCLIDPHGDLALSLHQTLTKPHLYWDVANPACAFGYNPIAPVSPAFRPLIASALIETLKKQWPDSWGARMEHCLRYAVLALLEQPSADLRDIVKLFIWKTFRKQVVEGIEDQQVRFFWQHEFDGMNYQNAADGVAPIANKLGAFLAHPTVRTVLCEPKEPLRLRQLMDAGTPLIVNLSKGRLGADVANVFGGLLVSSFMHAAFSRHDLPEHDRKPFFLHIDEFHAFSTNTLASMLSESRKYGLGLTLAHQHIVQTERAVFEAILGNVGTQIIFRVGAQDAPTFERQLGPPFTTHDLINLPNHRACVQLMIDGRKSQPFTLQTMPPHQ